jgi:hypothetical protein
MEQRLSRDYHMPSRNREPINASLKPELFQQKVRQFLKAVIREDYQAAIQIGFMDVRSVQKQQYIEIVSVGEPFQLKKEKGKSYEEGRHIYVPFEVKQANGDIYRAVINMRNDKVAIRDARSQLGITIADDAWVFDGGF